MNSDFDIIIIGAGPAGCTSAYLLSGKGLRVAVIEKAVFPRDKICGDALSPDVINQFYRIDSKLAEGFLELSEKKDMKGVRLFAPNYKHTDIHFSNVKTSNSAAYVSKRIDFDNFYFNQIKDLPDISTFQNQKVLKVENSKNGVIVTTETQTFKAKTIIGADGANSIVNRQLSDNTIKKNHYCAGVRQYFEGVSHSNHSCIELHYYNDIQPGYFWIFFLPNNQVNVGLGMLSSEVSKSKINLKEKLADIIQNHPNIKGRFENVSPLGPIKGFGLPLGSRKVQCSGNRFLLLGDAANLIDPFTGEGIGNAIRSGRIAADHLLKAFKENRFDAQFNKSYDKEIYDRMWTELRISRLLQKAVKYPKIVNYIVKKANTNQSFQTLITSMLNDMDMRNELKKPSFYIKLLFN